MISKIQIRMELKVNDKVQVVDDTLEGRITEIKNDQIWLEDEDGFLHAYKKEQVVKVTEPLEVNPIEIDRRAYKKFEVKTNDVRTTSPKRSKKIPEIDLHIHELTDSSANMTDFDMLQMQLRTAENRLKKAIENKEKRLVFIHGKGKGRLKKELSLLFSRYNEVSYYDADFREYGFGATEIYIYENIQ